MSTSKIYEAVIGAARRRLGEMRAASSPIKHLDIGAGRGDLIRQIASAFECVSQACDYHVDLFEAQGVPISPVNLNSSPLPYSDHAFDLVTCSEVVEHLENYRNLLREAYRVLKPGGALVVTTPNVLNMYSRARYFVSGFANLFGPLPARNDKLYSAGGHITPIPYFYLAHAFLDAGFSDVELETDKHQKTSVCLFALFFPIVLVGWWRFLMLERRKYRTMTSENEQHVVKHVSWPALVGRTLVVSAIKPN